MVVEYEDGDEPILLRADGSVVDTWRENYPYSERMTRDDYDLAKRLLQIELLKMQYWIKDTGRRMVIVCEGRDEAEHG